MAVRHHFSYDSDVAVVNTSQGKIRGYEYDGLSIFRGVPYAKARRFHEPVPVEAWDGVLNCTNYGYVCPLLENEKPTAELCVSHRYWIMDEDCLNLNIWTPGLDDQKRTVMVWLHGGGFEAGSAIEHLAYDGENMSRDGNVLVVSINHRLNVLGYMDLSAFGEEYENSGNAGTADIIAALRWIHDNIEHFGGNPDNVCLFGQSGGGCKITALLQSPEADGLFHKGIIMSGVTGDLLPDCSGSGETFVRALMDELHLDNVKELEEIPYALLAQAYVKLRPTYKARGLNTGGTPFVNEHYAGDPVFHGFREETSQIPLLIGSVFGEFRAFSPAMADKNCMSDEGSEAFVKNMVDDHLLDLFREAYPERNVLDLLQIDYIFRKAIIEYVKKRAALNKSTYSYLFNQDTALENGRVPWHCADIPYVFHNTEMALYTQQYGVSKLEQTIFESVMSFARRGNPNNRFLPAWKPDTPEKEYVMFLDNEPRIAINPDHQLIPEAERQLTKVYADMDVDSNIQH